MRSAITWLRSEDRLVLGALLALHLLPVWAFTYFPSQDGPAHVETAEIVQRYPVDERLQRLYALNPSLEPNLLAHLLTRPLLAVFSPGTIEKILVSAYVVLLPLGARYAFRAVSRDGGAVANLIFPFLFNWLVYMGFYNHLLSLPVFFWTIGYAWRHREGAGLGTGGRLALLGVLLYMSHIVSLVMAAAVLAPLVLAALLRRRPGDPRYRPRLLLVAAGAAAPALLLAADFLSRKGAVPPPPLRAGLVWRQLSTLDPLVVFDEREAYLGMALFWGLLLLATGVLVHKIRGRSWGETDILLASFAVTVVVCFTAPRGMSGGAALPPRLQLFPPWLLLLWLAGHPLSAGLRRAVTLIGVGFAIAFLAVRLPRQAALDRQLVEYASVGRSLPRGITLLPLCYERKGVSQDGRPFPSRVEPFVHAASRIAVERGIVELANYQGNKGHFPVLFRPEHNPYTQMGTYSGIELDPPSVDIRAYTRHAGEPIDYVLTWGMETYERRAEVRWRHHPNKVGDEPERLASVRRELAAGYELVDVSEPSGLARLYKRRPDILSPPP